MKQMFALLMVAGCLATNAHADTVTLTRNDVTDVGDIEAAIATATRNGTVAGKVILDGSEGRFTFPDFSDQSIDITVSNLTITGRNAAALDAGFAFGSVEVSNIVIEGLEIQSPVEDGVAILSTGTNVTSNVTIRSNSISSQASAFFVSNATDWRIKSNTISSGAEEDTGAITLLGARASEIIGNRVTSGAWGIVLTASSLRESTGNQIVANQVSARGRGMVLTGAASRNTVLLNHISLGESSDTVTGVFLDTGTARNRVLFNKASAAAGGSLVTVQDLGSNNRVSGNRP
ncbi:MAG: Periplasmic copper-binding protein (NosD) [Moraxellaceae bacterium]|nr:Periplasmic copper-binding protein (NosD) [Moraxellaceae bacterium]